MTTTYFEEEALIKICNLDWVMIDIEAIQTTIEEQTEFAVDFYYEFFFGGPEDDNDSKSEPDNESN